MVTTSAGGSGIDRSGRMSFQRGVTLGTPEDARGETGGIFVQFARVTSKPRRGKAVVAHDVRVRGRALEGGGCVTGVE